MEENDAFYFALEGKLLAEETISPLRVGGDFQAPVTGYPLRMTASFSTEHRCIRLGNSLYRLRGRIRASGKDAWVLDVGFPVLCLGPLASCFAPRKWIEGVFSLTLDGHDRATQFAQSKGCELLVGNWQVTALYRDDAFWRMIQAQDDLPVPLPGQVTRALRYFENLGAETHWERLQELGPNVAEDAHFLVTMRRITSPGDPLPNL